MGENLVNIDIDKIGKMKDMRTVHEESMIGMIYCYKKMLEKYQQKDTGFKYQDGNPICNNDMFQFQNGDTGFVWYDHDISIWSVKYHSTEDGKDCISSLQAALPFIAKFLA